MAELMRKQVRDSFSNNVMEVYGILRESFVGLGDKVEQLSDFEWNIGMAALHALNYDSIICSFIRRGWGSWNMLSGEEVETHAIRTFMNENGMGLFSGTGLDSYVSLVSQVLLQKEDDEYIIDDDIIQEVLTLLKEIIRDAIRWAHFSMLPSDVDGEKIYGNVYQEVYQHAPSLLADLFDDEEKFATLAESWEVELIFL